MAKKKLKKTNKNPDTEPWGTNSKGKLIDTETLINISEESEKRTLNEE